MPIIQVVVLCFFCFGFGFMVGCLVSFSRRDEATERELPRVPAEYTMYRWSYLAGLADAGNIEEPPPLGFTGDKAEEAYRAGFSQGRVRARLERARS